MACSCFNSAFSSFNAVVENIASTMLSSFQHSPYSNLYVKMASLRDNAMTAADLVCKIFRQWGVEIISNLLFNCMVFLNPKLSATQQSQLLVVMSRAMENFAVGGTLDEQLIRSIITLASPDHGTCLLLNYLIEAFTGLSSSHCDTPHQIAQDASSDDPEDSDREVAVALIKHFGIKRAAVAAMPAGVRKAILRALNGHCGGTDTDSEGHSSPSPPICCITLEPLLWPDCTVSLDVVAVIQRNHRAGKDHAFLYRGCALYDWLGRGQLPVSPETRSIVQLADIYRLS